MVCIEGGGGSQTYKEIYMIWYHCQ